MPIPSTVADLNATAALNSPTGSESPTQGDDFIRAHASIIRQVSDALVASGVALADTASSANGDALVGVKKTVTGAIATTQHEVNEREANVLDLIPLALRAAIVAGSSTTDVQPYIEAACLAYAGRDIKMPAGTYMVTKGSAVYSKTRIIGEAGTKIKALSGTWTGTTGVLGTAPFFYNFNNNTTTLTDQDISIENIEFDYDTVTVIGGGAHAVRMRAVLRPRVINCVFTGGENATAFLACKDSLVDECESHQVINCFYDHWDGAISGTVRNCIGRNTALNMAQGIQFTGTGSLLENRDSVGFLVEGCRLFGVRNSASDSAAAIIFNANDAGSTVVRCKSANNYVEDSDIGICFQGGTGQHESNNDTFKSVDKLPIFFNSDASGTPSNCRVIDPHLIDCDHLSANFGLVLMTGTNNRVKGLKVTNTGAVAYEYIAWLTSTATTCTLEIEKAASGTSGRVVFDSTTSLVQDRDDLEFIPRAIPTVASAGTIAPTTGICYVSGTTTISTITVPVGCRLGGSITIIPSGLWVTNTAGNIYLASTAVVGKAIIFTYEPGLNKWFPTT